MKKEKKIEKIIKEFIEKGADLEHERWAKWQAYLFSKSEWTKNGYLIPKELCKRWQRQIDTPYEKLSEQEKESDRKEVRKYIPLLEEVLSQQKQELAEKIEFFERDMETRLHSEPFKIVKSGLEDIKKLISS